MKVRELITRLQNLNPEAQVSLMVGEEGTFCEIEAIEDTKFDQRWYEWKRSYQPADNLSTHVVLVEGACVDGP